MIKNNKLKEINLKNHTRYYFGDMISMNDLDNMLLNKKTRKNILIYCAEYKTPYSIKTFRTIMIK